MAQVRVDASRVVHAPPPVVYGILADYRVGHPSILPKGTFLSLEVEEGGVGAGTVISYRVKLGGAVRDARARITEPEPGRVLVETDLDNGTRTTFKVEPVGEGDSLVTFVTEWTTQGLRGRVEGLLAPRLLGKVYAEELENLAARAEGSGAVGPTG